MLTKSESQFLVIYLAILIVGGVIWGALADRAARIVTLSFWHSKTFKVVRDSVNQTMVKPSTEVTPTVPIRADQENHVLYRVACGGHFRPLSYCELYREIGSYHRPRPEWLPRRTRAWGRNYRIAVVTFGAIYGGVIVGGLRAYNDRYHMYPTPLAAVVGGVFILVMLWRLLHKRYSSYSSGWFPNERNDLYAPPQAIDYELGDPKSWKARDVVRTCAACDGGGGHSVEISGTRLISVPDGSSTGTSSHVERVPGPSSWRWKRCRTCGGKGEVHVKGRRLVNLVEKIQRDVAQFNSELESIASGVARHNETVLLDVAARRYWERANGRF